jgi:hypothetical protein
MLPWLMQSVGHCFAWDISFCNLFIFSDEIYGNSEQIKVCNLPYFD